VLVGHGQDASDHGQDASDRALDLETFYREDDRRRTHGSESFGFNWRDPSNTDPYRCCEVRWYRGTHEIAAVSTTYDPQKLAGELGKGQAADAVVMGLTNLAGPALGPAATSSEEAAALGTYLSDRDQAATKVEVHLLGLLARALERYWVLRDAYHLESQDDGLATLRARIAECEQGNRSQVHDGWLGDLLLKAAPIATPLS